MNQATVTVVVIEDDPLIRRFVHASLSGEGITVYEADGGRRGLIEVATRRPDLAVVDLGLPDIDGVEVIRQIRGWSGMPLLVLSARSHENEKVQALDAGADDYLTKPFGVSEFLARIRAQLRRRRLAPGIERAAVRFGEVEVDLGERRVTRAGEAVHLTALEYRLLGALIGQAGRVVTHRQLLQEVWGPTHIESHHYLRIYMGHLRRKLERNPACPNHIVTETGVGYRLVGLEAGSEA